MKDAILFLKKFSKQLLFLFPWIRSGFGFDFLKLVLLFFAGNLFKTP